MSNADISFNLSNQNYTKLPDLKDKQIGDDAGITNEKMKPLVKILIAIGMILASAAIVGAGLITGGVLSVALPPAALFTAFAISGIVLIVLIAYSTYKYRQAILADIAKTEKPPTQQPVIIPSASTPTIPIPPTDEETAEIQGELAEDTVQGDKPPQESITSEQPPITEKSTESVQEPAPSDSSSPKAIQPSPEENPEEEYSQEEVLVAMQLQEVMSQLQETLASVQKKDKKAFQTGEVNEELSQAAHLLQTLRNEKMPAAALSDLQQLHDDLEMFATIAQLEHSIGQMQTNMEKWINEKSASQSLGEIGSSITAFETNIQKAKQASSRAQELGAKNSGKYAQQLQINQQLMQQCLTLENSIKPYRASYNTLETQITKLRNLGRDIKLDNLELLEAEIKTASTLQPLVGQAKLTASVTEAETLLATIKTSQSIIAELNKKLATPSVGHIEIEKDLKQLVQMGKDLPVGIKKELKIDAAIAKLQSLQKLFTAHGAGVEKAQMHIANALKAETQNEFEGQMADLAKTRAQLRQIKTTESVHQYFEAQVVDVEKNIDDQLSQFTSLQERVREAEEIITDDLMKKNTEAGWNHDIQLAREALQAADSAVQAIGQEKISPKHCLVVNMQKLQAFLEEKEEALANAKQVVALLEQAKQSETEEAYQAKLTQIDTTLKELSLLKAVPEYLKETIAAARQSRDKMIADRQKAEEVLHSAETHLKELSQIDSLSLYLESDLALAANDAIALFREQAQEFPYLSKAYGTQVDDLQGRLASIDAESQLLTRVNQGIQAVLDHTTSDAFAKPLSRKEFIGELQRQNQILEDLESTSGVGAQGRMMLKKAIQDAQQILKEHIPQDVLTGLDQKYLARPFASLNQKLTVPKDETADRPDIKAERIGIIIVNLIKIRNYQGIGGQLSEAQTKILERAEAMVKEASVDASIAPNQKDQDRFVQGKSTSRFAGKTFFSEGRRIPLLQSLRKHITQYLLIQHKGLQQFSPEKEKRYQYLLSIQRTKGEESEFTTLQTQRKSLEPELKQASELENGIFRVIAIASEDPDSRRDWLSIQIENPSFKDLLQEFYEIQARKVQEGFIGDRVTAVPATATFSKNDFAAKRFRELVSTEDGYLKQLEEFYTKTQHIAHHPTLVSAFKKTGLITKDDDKRAISFEQQEVMDMYMELQAIYKLGSFVVQELKSIVEAEEIDLSRLAKLFSSEKYYDYIKAQAVFAGKQKSRTSLITAMDQNVFPQLNIKGIDPVSPMQGIARKPTQRCGQIEILVRDMVSDGKAKYGKDGIKERDEVVALTKYGSILKEMSQFPMKLVESFSPVFGEKALNKAELQAGKEREQKERAERTAESQLQSTLDKLATRAGHSTLNAPFTIDQAMIDELQALIRSSQENLEELQGELTAEQESVSKDKDKIIQLQSAIRDITTLQKDISALIANPKRTATQNIELLSKAEALSRLIQL